MAAAFGLGVLHHVCISELGRNPSLVRYIRNTKNKLAGHQEYISNLTTESLINSGIAIRLASFGLKDNKYEVLWVAEEVRNWDND